VGNYVSRWDDEVSLHPHAQRLIFLDATDSLYLIEQHGLRRKANIYLVSFVHGMFLHVAGCCALCVLSLTPSRRNSTSLRRKRSGRTTTRNQMSPKHPNDRAVYAPCHPI